MSGFSKTSWTSSVQEDTMTVVSFYYILELGRYSMYIGYAAPDLVASDKKIQDMDIQTKYVNLFRTSKSSHMIREHLCLPVSQADWKSWLYCVSDWIRGQACDEPREHRAVLALCCSQCDEAALHEEVWLGGIWVFTEVSAGTYHPSSWNRGSIGGMAHWPGLCRY